MPDQKPSILLGAAVAAVLSTSYLGLINCLCCAGMIAAGMVTVWHYTDRNRLTLPAGRAAVLGLQAAALGSFVAIFINFALIKMGIRADQAITEALISTLSDSLPPEQVDEMRTQMDQPVVFGQYFLTSMVGVLVSAIFGALGGVIGASVFKKGEEKDLPGPEEL